MSARRPAGVAPYRLRLVPVPARELTLDVQSVTVVLRGSLTTETVPYVRDQLQHVIGGSRCDVLLDLSQVSVVDVPGSGPCWRSTGCICVAGGAFEIEAASSVVLQYLNGHSSIRERLMPGFGFACAAGMFDVDAVEPCGTNDGLGSADDGSGGA